MAVRRKAGHVIAVLVHPVLALVFFMMRIFAYLEMMNIFILTDRDRVIFHMIATVADRFCLSSYLYEQVLLVGSGLIVLTGQQAGGNPEGSNRHQSVAGHIFLCKAEKPGRCQGKAAY